MPRLVEGLSRFFGRVEILALGLERERQAAEWALSRGRPLEARDHALVLLAELPGSALGLALWADAAEDAWLDHEVVHALSELSKKVPWRADVWLRLGRAGLRTEWPHAREALERAAAAPDEREDARTALLDLCDLDLAAGDAPRAARWLERIGSTLTDGAQARSGAGTDASEDRDVALRRAECALALGDIETARVASAEMGDDSPIDGRAALVRAKLSLSAADPEGAIDHATRSFLLDTRGAAEFLASLVAASRDAVIVDRVRRIVAASGEIDKPAWAAAFAFAEGRRDDARKALARGLSEGDRGAAAALLGLAVETRDLDALHALATRDPELLSPELRTLREAAVLSAQGRDAAALAELDRVAGDAASVAWADELRRAIVARWIPPSEGGEHAPPARWPELLQELQHTAKALDRLDLASAVEALAVERERPLRVAVVGEFNAGKSTFLNALLGEDVAPTGVLPTTATLHWVAWALDPFARVVVRGSPDRVVSHEALKPTLRSLSESGAKVERVFIYAPIERLKRVEILDTPGFNAPDPDHRTRARQAFDEAHVAIWLLDATGPMKESERVVLSEIRSLGVPVQILVNKADRLKPPDLEHVLAHIRESLGQTGIGSYAPPIAFSARLSLKGRLGDEAALAASGWAAVEALFSEAIVDASDALRETALRRKARRIAEDLAELAAARASEDRAAAQAAREQKEALRAASALLLRERRAIGPSIERAIEPARRLLASDLRPLAEVADGRQASDLGLRIYAEERFTARLTDALAAEIGRAAKVESPPRSAVRAVRSVLMGAAAAHAAIGDLMERPLDRIIEAAVEAYAAALASEAAAQQIPPPSAALSQRARAVSEALVVKTPPRSSA
jgi:small GTP-binding protein